jgi:hypothetical protein
LSFTNDQGAGNSKTRQFFSQARTKFSAISSQGTPFQEIADIVAVLPAGFYYYRAPINYLDKKGSTPG